MSTRALTLRVLTPEGIVFEKRNLQAVNIPLVYGGSIGIRPAHAPLIAETEQGEVTFQAHEQRETIDLYAGILDIYENVVTILTAGRVLTETSEEIVSGTQGEYDRLMQTLINRINPPREKIE